jgi:hypothetical protein
MLSVLDVSNECRHAIASSYCFPDDCHTGSTGCAENQNFPLYVEFLGHDMHPVRRGKFASYWVVIK